MSADITQADATRDADIVWELVRQGGPEAVAALSRVSQQIAREAVIDELLRQAAAILALPRDTKSVAHVDRAAAEEGRAIAYRLRARVTELRAEVNR